MALSPSLLQILPISMLWLLMFVLFGVLSLRYSFKTCPGASFRTQNLP